MRFDAGAASYLDVLYADNELFAAELAAIAARQSQQVNMITLYRALGGGWPES
jgi:multidrug efflux system outer membrane protein